MREILFRAYDKGRKEYLSDGHLFITINKDNRPNKSEVYLDVISNADKHKDRFTIEQYTGLTDKKGNKIFEGDIVKVFLKDGVETGYIRYRDAGCRFQFIGEYSIGYNIDNTTDFEIVGNIHDNSELLEESHK